MIKSVMVHMKRGVPDKVTVVYTDDPDVDSLEFPREPESLTSEWGEFDLFAICLGGGYRVTVEKPKRGR
jgi:hypothetical protein